MGDSGSSADNSDQVDDPEPSTSKRKRSYSRISRTRNVTASSTNNFQVSNTEWSEEEKMQLAVALQRFGHKDVQNLHKAVPTKSCEQIKSFTYWIIKKARLWFCNDINPGEKVPSKGKVHTKAPLDQWLYAFEQSQSTNRDEFRECLAKTFLYISRYEPHPDPKDCDGVDYAAMYEFMYLAINGYPVKAVTPETAAALLNALEKLSEDIKKYGDQQEQEFLSKVKRIVYVENATRRHYGKKKVATSEGPIKSLMDVKGFNPLNIPYEMLKKKSNEQ
ncbi:uncharacterized protein [Hetaerina americana]|uniref:uncharacterized protein n=1 Tax=Hetaerina americana TaxID=62018 RepID=UPI003A7F4DE3